MTDKSLNILLRRADWRFLLSNPNPKKSICFARGILEAAVDQVSETVIKHASDVNDCELAVAQNPTQETLSDAWAALKPGGSCYIEWNAGLLLNPKSIRHKLEAVGFDQIMLYLSKTNPHTLVYDVWLPLEDKNALSFFIDESLKDKHKNIFRRATILLRSNLLHLTSNLFIKLPWLLNSGFKNYTISSIACKSTISTNIISRSLKPTEAENNTENTIVAKLGNIGLNERFNNTSILMYSGGTSIYKKAILMIFINNQKYPSFIIKMPRIEKSASQLSIEAETLLTLQEKYQNLKGIPKVLYYKQNPGYSMVAETFINGTPIKKILTKKNYNEIARKGTEFLTELAYETKITAADDSWNKLVKPILSDFVLIYDTVLDPSIMQKIIDIIKDLEITQTVCHHTDFSPWNLLISPDGELGVLDWENSSIIGLPLMDLVYFHTYLNVYLEDSHEPRNFLECYRNLLDKSTYTGSVFNESLNYYCDKVEIPLSTVPAMRLLTWLYVLNWKFYDLNENNEEPPPKETLENILQINLLKEELELQV